MPKHQTSDRSVYSRMTENSYKTNLGDTVTIRCHFPKEAPEGALHAVTTALQFAGVFDSMNIQHQSLDS